MVSESCSNYLKKKLRLRENSRILMHLVTLKSVENVLTSASGNSQMLLDIKEDIIQSEQQGSLLKMIFEHKKFASVINQEANKEMIQQLLSRNGFVILKRKQVCVSGQCGKRVQMKNISQAIDGLARFDKYAGFLDFVLDKSVLPWVIQNNMNVMDMRTTILQSDCKFFARVLDRLMTQTWEDESHTLDHFCFRLLVYLILFRHWRC